MLTGGASPPLPLSDKTGLCVLSNWFSRLGSFIDLIITHIISEQNKYSLTAAVHLRLKLVPLKWT